MRNILSVPSRRRRAGAVAALVLACMFIAGTANAATKYYLESGSCSAGNFCASWWCVIAVNASGIATEVWGEDCAGVSYHKHYDVHPVSSDPSNGMPATTTDVGENGQAFWIATFRGPDNEPTECIGKDANGTFWEGIITN
ncbi:MAG: hypothetical protein JST22_12270 [Bacteroidetes bacterium]|nr:hypothetical protein [Bacteroidota bacterium]